MPKIVDWDARRDEILSATWRVIARDGITGATIRAIAREADCSRGILAHYFDDKADILGSALVMSHRRVVARMEARAAGLTGLDALRVIMLEALPLDDQRDLEAQIEISFWGRALGNPELRRLQHAEFDRFAERLRGHLAQAGARRATRRRGPRAGRPPDARPDRRAQRRARALPGPGHPARQRQMLDELLRKGAASLSGSRDVIRLAISQHGTSPGLRRPRPTPAAASITTAPAARAAEPPRCDIDAVRTATM